ncbi:MAG: HlyD family efflux transporter periplasmic adaptor subunit [Holosporales bacterium]
MKSSSHYHNVTILETCMRRHTRLGWGIKVEWQGEFLELANWSISGIGVFFKDCPWGFHEAIELRLHLSLADSVVPLMVKAVLVHKNPQTHHVGLKFLDPTEGTTLLLTEFFESAHTEQLPDASRFMENLRSSPAIIKFIENVDSKEKTQKQKGLPSLVLYLIICICCILFLNIITLLHERLFVFSAEYATITQDTVNVYTPKAGLIRFLTTETNENVKINQPLAIIFPLEAAEKIALLESALQTQKDKVRVLENADKTTTNYRHAVQDILYEQNTTTALEVQAAQARLREAQTVLSQVEKLAQHGFTTRRDLDAARSKAAAAQANLQKAIATTKVFDQNSNAAITLGRVEIDLPNGHIREPSDAHQTNTALGIAQAELKGLERQYKNLIETQGGTIIRSPCNCRLVRLNASSGRYLAAGAPIMDMVEGNNPVRRIVAKMPQDALKALNEKIKARVRPAGDSAWYPATIQRIERIGVLPETSGLPDTIDKDQRFATVELLLDEHLPPTTNGLGATVYFNIRNTRDWYDYFASLFRF